MNANEKWCTVKLRREILEKVKVLAGLRHMSPAEFISEAMDEATRGPYERLMRSLPSEFHGPAADHSRVEVKE